MAHREWAEHWKRPQEHLELALQAYGEKKSKARNKEHFDQALEEASEELASLLSLELRPPAQVPYHYASQLVQRARGKISLARELLPDASIVATELEIVSRADALRKKMEHLKEKELAIRKHHELKDEDWHFVEVAEQLGWLRDELKRLGEETREWRSQVESDVLFTPRRMETGRQLDWLQKQLEQTAGRLKLKQERLRLREEFLTLLKQERKGKLVLDSKHVTLELGSGVKIAFPADEKMRLALAGLFPEGRATEWLCDAFNGVAEGPMVFDYAHEGMEIRIEGRQKRFRVSGIVVEKLSFVINPEQ